MTPIQIYYMGEINKTTGFTKANFISINKIVLRIKLL